MGVTHDINLDLLLRLEDTDFDMFLTGREKALAGQNLQVDFKNYCFISMTQIVSVNDPIHSVKKISWYSNGKFLGVLVK